MPMPMPMPSKPWQIWISTPSWTAAVSDKSKCEAEKDTKRWLWKLLLHDPFHIRSTLGFWKNFQNFQNFWTTFMWARAKWPSNHHLVQHRVPTKKIENNNYKFGWKYGAAHFPTKKILNNTYKFAWNIWGRIFPLKIYRIIATNLAGMNGQHIFPLKRYRITTTNLPRINGVAYFHTKKI